MFIQGPGLLAPNRPYGYGLPASHWGQGYRRCSRARPLRSLPSASFQQVEKMPEYRSPGCLWRSHVAKRNGLLHWLNRLLGETLCRGRSPSLTSNKISARAHLCKLRLLALRLVIRGVKSQFLRVKLRLRAGASVARPGTRAWGLSHIKQLANNYSPGFKKLFFIGGRSWAGSSSDPPGWP